MKKQIVLAFSGGLDTSFCVPWLTETFNAEVHAVYVECGYPDESRRAVLEDRATSLGASHFEYIEATGTLYTDILSWLIKGNVIRDHVYPLSVGAERFVQAQRIAEYAKNAGIKSVAHGSTGAGNDQVRFDTALRTLLPGAEIITPIRDQELSRGETTAFLNQRGHDVPEKTTSYSINSGIWGTSIGGKETTGSEDALPFQAFPELGAPHNMQDEPEEFELTFEKGLPVAINGEAVEPLDMLKWVTEFGTRHGIGRGMHLGDTIIGIKGRIGFEAPAAYVLIQAHRELEKLVLTQEQRQIKDSLAVQYGNMLHEGKYFNPVMRNMEAFFDATQENVTGKVRLYGYRGNLFPLGSDSPHSMMAADIARYGEDNPAWTGKEDRAFTKLYSIGSQLAFNK